MDTTTVVPPWTVPKGYTIPIPSIVISNSITLLILLSLLAILAAILINVSNCIYRDIIQSLQQYENLCGGKYDYDKESKT